ncbi:MAG TPA: DUF2299 family protein [Methanothrix soehngenii]|nr:DUF2299 family protein [Methanothrix soehngenii]
MKTSEEAKRLIKEWMVSRGLPAKEVDQKNTVFQIESKTPTDIVLVAIQSSTLPRSVFIITKIDIHPAHLEALKSVNPERRTQFLWELKKELASIPPAFLCQPIGSIDTVPESIQFMKEISFDELTEGRLIEAMDQTCRGIILTAWIFLKEFGAVEA